MGLTTIKKRVRQQTGSAPDVKIDLSAFLEEGDTDTVMTFREPRAQDLFTSPKRRLRLKLNHPAFSDALIGQVMLLASCYVPGKDEEAGVNLDDIVCDVAVNQRDMFLQLVTKFGEAFPMTVSADEAGND